MLPRSRPRQVLGAFWSSSRSATGSTAGGIISSVTDRITRVTTSGYHNLFLVQCHHAQGRHVVAAAVQHAGAGQQHDRFYNGLRGDGPGHRRRGHAVRGLQFRDVLAEPGRAGRVPAQGRRRYQHERRLAQAFRTPRSARAVAVASSTTSTTSTAPSGWAVNSTIWPVRRLRRWPSSIRSPARSRAPSLPVSGRHHQHRDGHQGRADRGESASHAGGHDRQLHDSRRGHAQGSRGPRHHRDGRGYRRFLERSGQPQRQQLGELQSR